MSIAVPTRKAHLHHLSSPAAHILPNSNHSHPIRNPLSHPPTHPPCRAPSRSRVARATLPHRESSALIPPPATTTVNHRAHLACSHCLLFSPRSLQYHLLRFTSLPSYSPATHIPWLRALHRRPLTLWIPGLPRTPRPRMRPSLAVPRHPACPTSRKVGRLPQLLSPVWRPGQSTDRFHRYRGP